MFQRLVLLGTMSLALGCAGADSPNPWGSDAPALRIASYNIHHWVGTDDEVDLERIADVIESLGADVVAVQEADNNLLPDRESRRQEVVEELLGYRWVRFDDAGAEVLSVHGNGLLVAPGVEIEDAQWVDVSEAGRDPRAFTRTSVVVRGQRMRIVGAHFGLNAKERRRQVRTLSANLADAEHDGTVVVGDFNEWNPLATTFRPLRASLIDVVTASSFPSTNPLFRLDRIFTSPHADIRHVEVIRSSRAVGASDHLPVRAELVF